MDEMKTEVEERVDEPVLKSDFEAEEHMQKIRYWEGYERRMLEHFQKQIALAKEEAANHIAYHKHLLYDYFARVPHHTTKTQETYALPSATLVMKKATEKLVQPSGDAEQAFLLSLAENGIKGYTKTKIEEKLDWQNYKKRLTIIDGKAVDKETGELVDIEVKQCEPEFGYKLNADEEEKDNGKQEDQIA